VHHANHFYGHAHILARYVGLDHPPRIWGYLQHGWNLHDGFAVGTVFAPLYPKLVWSEACARRGWAAGLRDYVTVGAPWLYLLRLEDQEGWESTTPERDGTLVYPFHGWEGQQVLGSHTDYVEEVKEVEGDVPITVCLHWNEYDNPKVRSQYEDAGVRVISHGQRGYLWKDTDVAFLYKQLAEVRRHRRVVSNRLSSAILYGASAGAEVGVYGDPMQLEADHAILGGAGKPRRLWPEMHGVAVPREIAALVAAEELGSAHVLPPEEVLDVLGWAPDAGRVPQPPPPAPPLEQPRGLWSLGSTGQRRRNSHHAPGADLEIPDLAPVVSLPAGSQVTGTSSQAGETDEPGARDRPEEPHDDAAVAERPVAVPENSTGP
jgi:hypothetical protein